MKSLGLLAALGLAAFIFFDHRSTPSSPETPKAPHLTMPWSPLPKRTPPTPELKSEENSLPAATAILDRERDADDRIRDVYRLAQAGPAAAPNLLAIVAAPLGSDVRGRSTEITLRIMALEGLDQLAADGLDLKDDLARVLRLEDDQTVRMLTLVALSGLDQNRAGKLNRFIDEELRAR